jgi:hypothetical protein
MTKFIKWFIGFAGAMIMAWLGNFFYDSTKNIPVLNLFTSFFNWLYDGGIAVLNYHIKVWVIFVALIGLWLLYRLFSLFSQKNDVPEVPDYTNYRKDIFKKWIWHWDWKLTDGKWKPITFIPCCPKDDVQLIPTGGRLNPMYYCPKCNEQYDGFRNPIESAIETEVLLNDKLNKNTYPRS